jgi:hypothetical protein
VSIIRKLHAPLACGLGALALVTLAGCGPVKLVANTNIPTPLVVKMPIAVALFIPKEFSTYVHNEERWSTDWRVELGKAQSEGITRLMSAMFERVVPVESVSAGQAHADSGVRAILEPSVEEFAFVTPRDAGSPFFAVSIKYRVNIYLPNGKLADSWGFTGYGTAPAQGLSSARPLQAATALAMRDAGAKLAVEFREQATVRGLLPEGATADTLKAAERDKAGEQESGQSSDRPSDPADPSNAAASGAPAVPVNTQQPIPVTTGGTPAEAGDQEEAEDTSPQAPPAKDEPATDESPAPEEPPKSG